MHNRSYFVNYCSYFLFKGPVGALVFAFSGALFASFKGGLCSVEAYLVGIIRLGRPYGFVEGDI